MLRKRVVLAVMAVLPGMATIEAAELSVGNLAIAPDETGTVEVSGNIAGESTLGVTVLLEITPRAGNVGTVEFTPAPPVDIVQLGDPWPGAGLFSPFDTDLTFSPVLNGSVDDNGTGLPEAVTFSGLLTGCPVVASGDAEGVWDVSLTTSAGNSSWEGLPTTLIAGTITIGALGILHVDDDAPGGGDGLSWPTAFDNLQGALVEAGSNGAITEIRVAAGTYAPAGPGGDRLATFQLISSVGHYGGYAGIGAPDPDERDPSVYVTTLTGDLNGDDGSGGDNSENSYHVVTASGTDAATVLDGFTITAGNADGPRFNGFADGAGMYNDAGDLTVTQCLFMGNTASQGGAGMINLSGSTAVVTNCSFIGNSGNYGAAIRNTASSPTVTNCTLTENTGNFAAGLNSSFTSNPTITNCVLWGNTAVDGTLEEAQIYGGVIVINYCCVQGWTGGLGGVRNIGDDPLFAGAGDPHLLPGSSCVNAGDNIAPSLPLIDFEGDDRPQQCRVDMGVDETPYFFDCQTNGVADACDIALGTSSDLNSNGVPDECDECVLNGDCDDGLFCNGGEICLVDVCTNGPAPCTAGEWCDETGDACIPHGNGDFDSDGDVDLADFADFQVCFDQPVGLGCEPANMAGVDEMIDLDDYAEFAQALTGP